MWAATERVGVQCQVVADGLAVHATEYIPGEGLCRLEDVASAQAGANTRYAEIGVQSLAETELHAGLDIVPQIAECGGQGGQGVRFQPKDLAHRQAPGALMQNLERWRVGDLVVPAVGMVLADQVVEAVLQ